MSNNLSLIIMVVSLIAFVLFLIIRHSKKKIGPPKSSPTIISAQNTSAPKQTFSNTPFNFVNTEVKNTSVLNIIFVVIGILSIFIGVALTLSILLTLPGVIMIIAGFIFFALGELVHNAQLQSKILQRILNNFPNPNNTNKQ